DAPAISSKLTAYDIGKDPQPPDSTLFPRTPAHRLITVQGNLKFRLSNQPRIISDDSEAIYLSNNSLKPLCLVDGTNDNRNFTLDLR
ncbi:hypothetical protein FS749_008118, partial [Ceratobasidium sp. UAMH 11750]